MSEENVIEISSDNITVIDNNEYKGSIKECFSNLPDIAQTIINSANKSLNKIESLIYNTPAFINLIKASVPETSYQAILTNSQKSEIAKGAVKLMTKKDGSLMANLVDTKTNKIVDTISLKGINITPEFSQAMCDFTTQMQMAQIAEQMQVIQFAVEEVRQGQEFDRLATAYSCQQKLLQIMSFNNQELKMNALLNLALAAEDSRNLLMKSQTMNLDFVKNQPDNFMGKLLTGSKQEDIDSRINQIRESLNVVNMVSLVEAIAYQEMGEEKASKKSLDYYAEFIKENYLNDNNLLERLDLLDSSPHNYWTENLPIINNKIQEISENKKLLLEKGEDNNDN